MSSAAQKRHEMTMQEAEARQIVGFAPLPLKAIHSNAHSTVPMSLNGGRVLEGFRREVWDAAARSGLSVNEFCLRAVGQALVSSGANIPGVFRPGDIHPPSGL